MTDLLLILICALLVWIGRQIKVFANALATLQANDICSYPVFSFKKIEEARIELERSEINYKGTRALVGRVGNIDWTSLEHYEMLQNLAEAERHYSERMQMYESRIESNMKVRSGAYSIAQARTEHWEKCRFVKPSEEGVEIAKQLARCKRGQEGLALKSQA